MHTDRHFRSQCLIFQRITPLSQSMYKCTAQYYSSVWMEIQIKPKWCSGVFNLFTTNALNSKLPRCREEKEDFFPEVLFPFFFLWAGSYSWIHIISEYKITSVLSTEIRNMKHTASRLEFVLNVSISNVFTSWLLARRLIFPIMKHSFFPFISQNLEPLSTKSLEARHLLMHLETWANISNTLW